MEEPRMTKEEARAELRKQFAGKKVSRATIATALVRSLLYSKRGDPTNDLAEALVNCVSEWIDDQPIGDPVVAMQMLVGWAIIIGKGDANMFARGVDDLLVQCLEPGYETLKKEIERAGGKV